MGNEVDREPFRDLMNPDAADEEPGDDPGVLRDNNQGVLT
jgi:hypothetical protein